MEIYSAIVIHDLSLHIRLPERFPNQFGVDCQFHTSSVNVLIIGGGWGDHSRYTLKAA